MATLSGDPESEIKAPFVPEDIRVRRLASPPLPDTLAERLVDHFMKRLRAKSKPRPVEDLRYQPGDSVPASGIYCIEHGQLHRLMHTATLLAQSRFPRCKQCGDAVRFTLVRRVHDWRAVPFRTTAILEEYPDDPDPLPRAG